MNKNKPPQDTKLSTARIPAASTTAQTAQTAEKGGTVADLPGCF